ncbi:MAG: Single-stranded DNA-binding protein [Candidatus Levybacteria bacterium GW2011_GWB1_41_21]|nr:MAG: Single-stranded DNA-binding protein [Candidatus Levybacteria bacterium GW2011_GWB1_41_21]
MPRSLNRVQLIGNLTRDPELRYTPQGTAVCSFGIATNRSWTTDSGEKKEDAEFHKIVAWNKLAELCSQFLVKGRKVFVEGRLSTRSWNAQDGTQKTTTEIIISDMILLDSSSRGARKAEESEESEEKEEAQEAPEKETKPSAAKPARPAGGAKEGKGGKPVKKEPAEEVAPDDIPF